MLSKQEALKEIAEKVEQASKLMEEATQLSRKHKIEYSNEDGYVFYGEDEEENDDLYSMRRALLKWNSSTCY